MCYQCYLEQRRGNTRITPKMKALAKDITKFYQREIVGGAMHIVFDDWNLEDDDIDFCLKESVKRKDPEAKKLGERFKRFTVPERVEILNLTDELESRDYKKGKK